MINETKVIAFTFARAGSKGVKDKNIKLLAGKPLLFYACESSKECAFIDDYFLSTDGDKINQVADTMSINVIKRPARLASDKASELHAWQHAIEYLLDKGEMDLDDIFVSVPCTSPLRNSEDLCRAIEAFVNNECDLALGICEADRSPYFNMVTQDSDGMVEVICHNHTFVRRQDVPEAFNITTMVYVSTPRHILNTPTVLSGQILGVMMDKERSIDIDTELDFEIAEFLMSRQQNLIKA